MPASSSRPASSAAPPAGPDLPPDWQACLDAWLSRTANPTTRRRYRRAVERFFSAVPKSPGEVTGADLAQFLKNEFHHAQPNTAYACFKRLRSFYAFAVGQGLLELSPAAGMRLPHGGLFLKASALEPGELRRLFAAIDRETPYGSRDYALYLLILSTGLKASQALRLRCRDLVLEEGQAWLTRPASAGAPRRSLPFVAWEALQAYLQLSGKAASLRPGSYLFTPLHDLTGQLHRLHASAWRNQPLSLERAAHFLRTYGRWAGLDASRLTLESLRSSGALLRHHLGASTGELCDFLGLSSPWQARRFLQRLRPQPAAQTWLHPASPLPLPGRAMDGRLDFFLRRELLPLPGQPSLGRCGQPCLPGPFTLALRCAQKKANVLIKQGESSFYSPVERQLAFQRLVMRSLFAAMSEDLSLSEMIKFTTALGRLGTKIARLLVASREFDDHWEQRDG